jgi:hypothetical protein
MKMSSRERESMTQTIFYNSSMMCINGIFLDADRDDGGGGSVIYGAQCFITLASHMTLYSPFHDAMRDENVGGNSQLDMH